MAANGSSQAKRDVLIGSASLLVIAILIFAGLGLTHANSDLICTRVVQGPAECTQGSWGPWTQESQTQDASGNTVLTEERTYTGIEENQVTLQYQESAANHGGGSCENGYAATGQGGATAGMVTDEGGSGYYQATTEYTACQVTETQTVTTSGAGASESASVSVGSTTSTGATQSQTVGEDSLGALDQAGVVTSANGETASLGSESAAISAKPELVQSGQTTQIIVKTAGMSTCAVTGSNGDAWSGLNLAETSAPITAQTVYKLGCLDQNGAAFNVKTTVGIAPNYQEQ